VAARGFSFPEFRRPNFAAVTPAVLLSGQDLVPEARHGNETFRGWLENNADTL
jgi:hypothetical protein